MPKNDVSRLLSTQSRTSLKHLFQDILIADVGAQHANAGVPQRNFEAHVRHGSCDNSCPSKKSASMHVLCGKEQNSVSVYHTAVGIAEQRAIGVSVESNAEVESASGLSDLLCDRVRMQCPALFVDVLAVWRGVYESRLHATGTKQFGSFGGGCTVGTVRKHTDTG